MKKIISKYSDLLIIFGFFCLNTVLLLIKIRYYHGFVIDWDEAHHLKMAFYFFSAFNTNNWEWLSDLLTQSSQIYPPIYHILISYIYHIVGISSHAAVIANLPFILITMLSIYGIGICMDNRKAGLFASILTPFLPVFLTLQERVAIDYASVAIFTLSFYLLFKTKDFTDRKYSILFGITIFTGLLLKWPFVIPGAPFVFYAIRSIWQQKIKRGQVLINIFVAFGISIPALIWYYFNFKYILIVLDFFWNPNGFPQHMWSNPSGLSLKNILLYLFDVPNHYGVGFIVLVYFYFSFFLIKGVKKIGYLTASVFITYIVLTVMNDKSSFYIAYTYPLLMLTTTFGLSNLKPGFGRRIAYFSLFAVIFLNFFLTQFNYSTYKIYLVNLFNTQLFILPNYDTKFSSSTWPTKFITDNYITDDTCPHGVLVFPDNRFLNAPVIEYFLTIENKSIHATPAYEHYNPATDTGFDPQILNTFACIITKDESPGFFANKTVINYVNNYLRISGNYNLKLFDAPDNSTIWLFTKKQNGKD